MNDVMKRMKPFVIVTDVGFIVYWAVSLPLLFVCAVPWSVGPHSPADTTTRTGTAIETAIGIGGGLTSRVDAAFLAAHKAAQLGHDPSGSVLASDGFFPFADGVEEAAEIVAAARPEGVSAGRLLRGLRSCNSEGTRVHA